MSKSLNHLHPATQHLNRVAIAIAPSRATAGPTASLVNNVCRAFGCSQSVPNAVPEGVHFTAFRVICPESFVMSGTR